MSRTRQYLQLVRLPAVFTAISNIAAAHLVATRGQVDWTSLLLLCLASITLLSAGMALNDCFDLEIDRRERPSRPLPSGRIPVRSAWTLGFALLAVGIGLAAIVGMRAFLVAILLAGAILLYDGALKSGGLGPFSMALCRYLNWLLGLSVVPLTGVSLLLPLPIFFYICAVTYLSRTESTADDKRLITVAQIYLVLAALAFLALSVAGVYSTIWVAALAVAGAGLGWRLLELTRRRFSPSTVQTAVGLLLLGIIPLDVLMAMANGVWWSVVLLALMLPGKWVGRRLYVT